VVRRGGAPAGQDGVVGSSPSRRRRYQCPPERVRGELGAVEQGRVAAQTAAWTRTARTSAGTRSSMPFCELLARRSVQQVVGWATTLVETAPGLPQCLNTWLVDT